MVKNFLNLVWQLELIFLISKSTFFLISFGKNLIFLISITLDDIFFLFFEKISNLSNEISFFPHKGNATLFLINFFDCFP